MNRPRRATHTLLWLTRVPFTLLTATLLAVAAVLTGSHLGTLSEEFIRRYGFAPHDLVTLDWSRVGTSVFLTEGGASFWFALAAVLAFVGWAEIAHGTPVAAVTFWASHVLTLAVTFGISLPSHLAGHDLGSLVYLARDIGPSAGYVGCLALALATLDRRWRGRVLAAVMIGLATALVVAVARTPANALEVSAALAHAVAFPLGLVAASLVARRRPKIRV